MDSMGMAGLSRSFYETACDLIAPMATGQVSQFVKTPSAVVILTVASLEAYINEYLAGQIQNENIQTPPRESLEEKWLQTPLRLGFSTFDNGSEPFQSFSLLIKLRNSLAHYSPEFMTPAEFPSCQIEMLKSKFEFTHVAKANWTSQVLNLECARWACRTTKEMVRKFHLFVGGINWSGPPDPWPDPP